MSAQHTPGPWCIETKGSRHFIDGADGLTVTFMDRRGVRENQEIEANARLIAAAPDLLEALKEAEIVLAVALAWPGSEATRSKMRAAIAKAEAAP